MIYRKNTIPTNESIQIYTQKIPVHKNYITVRHKMDVQYSVLFTLSSRPKTTSKNHENIQNRKRTGIQNFTFKKYPLQTLMNTTLTAISQNVPIVQKTVQCLYSLNRGNFQ